MSKKIAIICSQFNKDLVESLYKDASAELMHSIKKVQLDVYWVPGAGEIPLFTKWIIEQKKYDGLLTLGVIIRGETTHYDSLCRILEKSLWDLQKKYSLPVIFSILTVENRDQALYRIQKGRGKEHAKTLSQMIKLKEHL